MRQTQIQHTCCALIQPKYRPSYHFINLWHISTLIQVHIWRLQTISCLKMIENNSNPILLFGMFWHKWWTSQWVLTFCSVIFYWSCIDFTFHWQTYGNRFICSLYSSSLSGSSLNLSYFPVFMLMRDPYLCFMLSPMLLVFSTTCLMVSFVDISKFWSDVELFILVPSIPMPCSGPQTFCSGGSSPCGELLTSEFWDLELALFLVATFCKHFHSSHCMIVAFLGRDLF